MIIIRSSGPLGENKRRVGKRTRRIENLTKNLDDPDDRMVERIIMRLLEI